MKLNGHQEKREIIHLGVLGGVSVVAGALFVVGMVQNGNGAVKRYNALMAADQAGGDVDTALRELRQFIYSHMNTEVGGPNGIYPPIQLKGTYDRLKAAEEQRVKETNDSLYSEAQEFCERTGNKGFSGSNRLDCINGYIDENGAKPVEIQESLYKYDFVAPRWSPDMAGFSLLVFILVILVFSVKLFWYFRTRHFIQLGN